MDIDWNSHFSKKWPSSLNDHVAYSDISSWSKQNEKNYGFIPFKLVKIHRSTTLKLLYTQKGVLESPTANRGHRTQQQQRQGQHEPLLSHPQWQTWRCLEGAATEPPASKGTPPTCVFPVLGTPRFLTYNFTSIKGFCRKSTVKNYWVHAHIILCICTLICRVHMWEEAGQSSDLCTDEGLDWTGGLSVPAAALP